jgi:hypothetical protein
MIKRIIAIILYILWIPLFIVCCYLISVTALVALFVYIIKGDENDTVKDIALLPVHIAMDLQERVGSFLFPS